MNILYVGNFVFPDKSPGALKVLSFAKIFRHNGHAVSFASTYTDDSNGEIQNGSCEDFSVISKAQKHTTLSLVKKLFDISLFDYAINASKYDIVIAYNPQSIANMRMCHICKKMGIKYICDIDEWDEPLQSYNALIKLCVKFNIWLNMSFANKQTDGLILSSNYLKHYYDKRKTVVIPPLVDITDEKWNVQKTVLQEGRTIVYFGSGGSVKEDLISIVDCISNMPGYYLNIVGITQDEYEKDYNIPHTDYDNIYFWGRLPHTKALSIVTGSDCSLILRYPTRKNNAGFPTKFVESISLGVPVLCNDFSDVKQYLTNNTNGMIVSKESLKNDIEDYYSRQILVNRKTFDVSNNYQKLNDFIINL